MSEQQPGPGAGAIIAGIFLILAGLCLTLVGGGCTLFLLSSIPSVATSGGGYGAEMMPLLLLSLVFLGAGVAMIWLGIKLMSGRLGK